MDYDSYYSLKQFASRLVSFTSEYSNTNWKAENLLGPPRVLNTYGDSLEAWCPSTNDTDQILELAYEKSVFITKVNVYENFNGGSVTKIEAFNKDHYETLWSKENASLILNYNIFSPEFKPINFLSNQIRLSLTQTGRGVFAEIDAVELVGSVIDLALPESDLSNDMFRLLYDNNFSDLEIELKDSDRKVKAHKCILALRAAPFFEYLKENNYKLECLSSLELDLLLEFVYTGELNKQVLKEILNLNILEDLGVEENEEEINLYKEKHLLVLSDLIRMAIRLKENKLERCLNHYLIKEFMKVENCLNILMDSVNSKCLNEAIGQEGARLNLKHKFRLENVEEMCLVFIRLNLKEVIRNYKFKLLPKQMILKIVSRI